MKVSLISLLTVTGLVIGSIAQAGNAPNSTRTLTSGIGGGTMAGSVPSSHPYSTRSRGYSYSGHSRNDNALRSIDYFRGGNAGGGYHPETTAYGGSRPDSFPGQGTEHMNEAALDRIPDFSSLPAGGGRPDTVPPVSSGIPTGVNPGGIPTSIPPVSTGIPSGVNPGGIPTSIPPVSTGIPSGVNPGGAPTSIPPVSTGSYGVPSNIAAANAVPPPPPVVTGMPPSITPPSMPSASASMATAAADAAAAGLANRGGAGRR